MKFLNIAAVAASLIATHAHASQLMTCKEIGGSRYLRVDSSLVGESVTLDGRTGKIDGSYADEKFTFQNGNWDDPDFLSLEIARVNGRYIGVMYTPATSGPAAYAESIFACAEILVGQASSSGG